MVFQISFIVIPFSDWGLHQLDCVRDTKKSPSLFFVVATFGNHALHHLFPTVDHSKLDVLYPVLIKTCRRVPCHLQ
jgi:fatty acid desaturase